MKVENKMLSLDCTLDFKDRLQLLLRIGSAHNKCGLATLSKFCIFKNFFELKRWFIFHYEHSKPKKCQIFS